jgi:hypothetical protein
MNDLPEMPGAPPPANWPGLQLESITLRIERLRFTLKETSPTQSIVHPFMKSLSLPFALTAQLFAASAGTRDLRCEYHASPLAIGTNQPRFSWKLTAGDPAARGLLQTAYELQVARSARDFEQNLLWTSGKVASAAGDQIVYAGKPLSNAKVEPHPGAPVRPIGEMAARRSKFTHRFI